MNGIGEALSEVLARQGWLDRPADTLQGAVARLFERNGERGQQVRDALHGRWLGHPLHPAVILLPLGAWSTAGALDALDALFGRRDVRAGADAAVAFGVLTAFKAAATGLTDWHHTVGRSRRVGLGHALLNTVALGLYTASWVLRRRGARGQAQALGFGGLGVVLVSGLIGGDLAYARQIGPDRAVAVPPPEDWAHALPEAELPADTPKRVTVQGAPVVLVRHDGHLHALADTCAHLGGPLSEGKLEGCSIICPWHGSRFSLADGQVLAGPSTYPQACYAVRVRDGQIEVRGPRQ